MNQNLEQIKLSQIRNAFQQKIRIDDSSNKYEILNYDFKDDCSYIKLSNNDYLVISSDFIRGEYFNMFQAKYMCYFDLGYFLVIANLSDIASSGARPLGISLILRYSDDMSDKDFQAILSGIKVASIKYNLDVLGGDTGSYKESVLAATITGIIANKHPMLRTNAQVGDNVYVSGNVGLAITSMVYFLYAKELGLHLEVEEEEILLKQWQSPKAFIDFGSLLSENNLSVCCQDVSDGLKASVEQISEASNVSMEIEESKIPLSSITKKVAEFLLIDPYKLAFSISADFNLLFTVSKDKHDDLDKVCTQNNINYYYIGTVIHKNKNTFITDKGMEEIPGIKWEHQSGDFIRDIVRYARL